jgi:KTSC domain-containing protein
MHITAVESTTLATVAYDEALELLQLRFRNGATYQYFAVPVAVHIALLGAESKGSYFNRVIRGGFRYGRISDGDREGSGGVVASGSAR